MVDFLFNLARESRKFIAYQIVTPNEKSNMDKASFSAPLTLEGSELSQLKVEHFFVISQRNNRALQSSFDLELSKTK